MEGQTVLPGLDLWFGKTSPEPCKQTAGAISNGSCRKSSKSANPTPPLCLCLKAENGQNPGASTMTWGGWSVAWRIHNSEFWGVPQKRRRIALVADFRGLAAPEVLFERKGLRGDSEESRATREDSSATAKSGFADTISFQERAGKPGGGKGILIQAEKTGTIGTHNNQSVYKHVYGASSFGEYKSGVAPLRRLGGADGSNNLVAETFGSLCASDFKGIRNQDIDQNKCLLTDGVRRITPTEAERLQGFPDGWTDLTEWTDTKGKVHKETPDTARYKALGNSIALPFWFWLLRRISAQYERPATLGSLFDGIGGFPLCWERCNGPGTAIWASEIEEFPIAVTKKHFPE